MFCHTNIKALILGVVAFWIVVPGIGLLDANSLDERMPIQCPSGHSAARLTGWRLNNKRPVGLAKYDESTDLLEVSVQSVGLPDGTVLSVLIGEDRIGTLSPLKNGEASGSITRPLEHRARVRVFNGERPIVSANLECSAAPTVVPTATPTPTPSPLPMSPTPSPAPTPTLTPSPDPMPKRSPVPTPSPSTLN